MAKLVLDDYFSSNEFLQTAEASAAYEGMMNSTSSTSSTPTMATPTVIPISHQLNSSSPFADSGIGLNMMSSTRLLNNNSVDIDDDVFIVENGKSSHFSIVYFCHCSLNERNHETVTVEYFIEKSCFVS